MLVGLLYERRHTRMFKEFGGLKQRMPIYAAIFLIVILGATHSRGVPAAAPVAIGSEQASRIC